MQIFFILIFLGWEDDDDNKTTLNKSNNAPKFNIKSENKVEPIIKNPQFLDNNPMNGNIKPLSYWDEENSKKLQNSILTG